MPTPDESGNQRQPQSEWQAVLDSWNKSQPPAFQVRSSDLLWNFENQDLVQYLTTHVADVPIVYGVASPNGVSKGLSTRSLWLSLWGSIPAGREDQFINELLRLAAEQGKQRCSIGADEFHFVPGIPIGTQGSQKLLDAAIKGGFSTTEECDFVGDIHSNSVTQYIESAKQKLQRPDEWQFRQVESESERDELNAFLQAEFHGRWSREFVFWRDRADVGRGFWASLRRGDGPMIGFARMAIRGRYQPLDKGWNPGALRLPLIDDKPFLYQDNDACLGPIGVAESERGKGSGKLLLSFVLQTLRENQVGRTCIDWTDAVKYYSPLEFKIVRKFRCAWRVSGA